jgi:hypothetical protein
LAKFHLRLEQRQSVIAISSTTGVVAPGIIQYIVSIPLVATTSNMDTFFVIEPYAQSLEVTSNPFSSHVEFGASLWSSKMSSVLEAVPMDRVVCHAILRPWVKGVVVLKALDRVGDFLSLFVLFDSRRSRLSSLRQTISLTSQSLVVYSSAITSDLEYRSFLCI